MSWLGSGLTQITGQISNFTKEVLTEGTEEVHDVDSELRVAKQKLLDLEKYVQIQKSEADRLKGINDDLEEKLESSELQNTQLSNKYRFIVQEKENEIQKLKHRGTSNEWPWSNEESPALLQEAHFEEGELEDVVQADKRINELKKTIAALQDENNTLKQERVGGTQPEEAGWTQDVSRLERELAQERDVCAQKLAQQQQRHLVVVRDFEERVEELEHLLDEQGFDSTQRDFAKEVHGLRAQVAQLEQQRRKWADERSALKRDLASQPPESALDTANSVFASTPIDAGKRTQRPAVPDSPEQIQPDSEVAALSTRVAELEEAQADQELEKEALEAVLMDLRKQLRETQKPSANQALLDDVTGRLTAAQNDLRAKATENEKLEEQLQQLRSENEAAKTEIQELNSLNREQEYANQAVQRGHADTKELRDRVSSLQEEVKVKADEIRSVNSVLQENNTHFAAVRGENEQLQRRLQSLEDELVRTEKERTELMTSLNRAKSVHDQSVHDADDLRSEIEHLRNEADDMKSKMADGAVVLQELHSDKQAAADQLQREHAQCLKLQQQMEAMTSEKTKMAADLKRAETQLEQLLQEPQLPLPGTAEAEAAREEISELKQQHLREVEQLAEELEALKKKLAEAAKSKDSLDVVGDMEKEIEDLNNRLLEKDHELIRERNELKKATQRVCSLEKHVTTSDAAVTQLQTTIVQKENELATLSQMLDYRDEDAPAILSEPEVEELREMRAQLAQKEHVVEELRSNNQSLLRMLETRSAQDHGDRSLVDLHSLQNDLRSQRTEKEHIMEILNQKSVECASLRKEVQELMGVVSQEKAAIAKLQQDNQELHNHAPAADADADMSREAVKKLSQIIKHREMEVEALKQKNETLLQVLQSDGSGSEQMTSVLKEKEELSAHLQAFQADREQLVGALNTKHAEAVHYHQEVLRLTARVEELTDVRDKVEAERTTLLRQFEDKQHSLLKVQNDAMNYKQRFGEIEQQLRQKEGELKAALAQLENVEYEMLDFKEKYTETDRRYKELSLKLQEEPHSPAIQKAIEAIQLETKDNEDADVTGLRRLLEESRGRVSEQSKELRNVRRDLEARQGELHNLRNALQSQKDLLDAKEKRLAELSRTVSDRDRELRSRDKAILDKDHQVARAVQQTQERERAREVLEQTLVQRDAQLEELNNKLHLVDEQTRAKESELAGFKKQQENLTFQLHGLQNELVDQRSDAVNLREKDAAAQLEVATLKETNRNLTMMISDKDFEINALKEKNNTLTKLMLEHEHEGEKGKMDQAMKEAEGLEQQAKMFADERDQFLLALQGKQAECVQLQDKLSKQTERISKLVREVERLRAHLLQVEDGYTQDALGAEEREKELRNKLHFAEEAARSAGSAKDSFSQEASVQLQALQAQLQSAMEARDAAINQLAHAQESAHQYATNLQNLQMVLEQFQSEKEVAQAEEVERYQRDLHRSSCVNDELKDQLHSLQLQVKESNDALAAAERLSEQLDRKTEAISALKDEVMNREALLAEQDRDIKRLTANTQAKVDKDMMKNLFVGYLHAPNNKRTEVVRVIGRVLDFNQQEWAQADAMLGGGGWFGSILRFGGAGASPSTPTTPTRRRADGNSSFSQMFVSFLEKESTPGPEIQLPAEMLAAETRARAQHRAAQSRAVNPFSAPVTSLPDGGGASPAASGAAHHQRTDSGGYLLMNPVSQPQLPLFAPVAAATTPTTSHSAQQSSSAILQGVLQPQ